MSDVVEDRTFMVTFFVEGKDPDIQCRLAQVPRWKNELSGRTSTGQLTYAKLRKTRKKGMRPSLGECIIFWLKCRLFHLVLQSSSL